MAALEHERTASGWPICRACKKSILAHHLKGLEVRCQPGDTTPAAFTHRQVADVKMAMGKNLTAADLKKLGPQGRLDI